MPRHREPACPRLHPPLDVLDHRTLLDTHRKVLQQLAMHRLHRLALLQHLVQKPSDRLEITLAQPPARHRRRPDPHTARRHRAHVPDHRVLVQRNMTEVARLLHLRPSHPLRPQVPENQMVVRPPRHQLVPLLHQRRPERTAVPHHLLLIRLELRTRRPLERARQRPNLVVMRPALQTRKHGKVDLVLKVIRRPLVLPTRQPISRLDPTPKENHPSPRTAKTLMRRRRHDIAVRKRLIDNPRSHQPGNMRHIHHQVRPHPIRNPPQPLIVPLPRVRTSAADDQLWPEIQRLLLQLVVIDVPRGRVELVGQALEENTRRRDLLPASGVIPVRQVPTTRQIQPHDAIMRIQQPRIHRKVRRTPRIRLHIHPPLTRIQTIGVQRPLLAQQLDLVDHLVATVVPRVGLPLRVLVGQARPQRFHHGEGREVLRGNELDAVTGEEEDGVDRVRSTRVRRGDSAIFDDDDDDQHSTARTAASSSRP